VIHSGIHEFGRQIRIRILEPGKIVISPLSFGLE
jgi:hypothetical protein